MIKLSVISGLAVAAAFGGWFAHPPPADSPPLEPLQAEVESAVLETHAAVEKALIVLARDGVAWFEGRTSVQRDGTGCVSCHQVPFGVWGLEEAERAGITVDSEIAADLTRRAIDFVKRPTKARAMSWGPLVLATHAEDDAAEGFVEYLLEAQGRDGKWAARGQFPGQRRDLEETDSVATLWTLLTLSVAAEAGAIDVDAPDTSASLARALQWLEKTGPGETTEWHLLATLLEGRLGRPALGDAALETLLGQQNADGGWSWQPGESSNAMTTGQVLYGLGLEPRTAASAESAAAERALRYLLETQQEDGFWELSSSLVSRQASEDKDYIYAYWATAWATIGLARFL